MSLKEQQHCRLDLLQLAADGAEHGVSIAGGANLNDDLRRVVLLERDVHMRRVWLSDGLVFDGPGNADDFAVFAMATSIPTAVRSRRGFAIRY